MTDVDRLKKRIFDKLAAEGGGTWAAHMMLDIGELVGAALGSDLDQSVERRAIELALASNDIWEELEETAVGEPSKQMYRRRAREALAQ